MVFRTLGVTPLARLLEPDVLDFDTAWLLFGPTDADVVEPAEDAPPMLLLAAE